VTTGCRGLLGRLGPRRVVNPQMKMVCSCSSSSLSTMGRRRGPLVTDNDDKGQLQSKSWSIGGQRRCFGSIYEPDYLDSGGSDRPVFDLLNIQLKGYDFPVLEKFTTFVHRTAERMGVVVEDAWVQPAQNLRVTKLKPESNVVDSEYLLNVYERNVQISEVPGTLLPVLINAIQAALPAGVTLRVHPHYPIYTEARYVPDLELNELRAQLETWGGKK